MSNFYDTIICRIYPEIFIRKLKGQPAINNKIDQKLDAAYQKYKELATVL